MRALLLAMLLGLPACTNTPPVEPEPRLCPPLPELQAKPTPEQWANHYAVVIRLYAQCAGAPTEGAKR